MQIKRSSINRLAEMICGNEPFTYFPYRSSSYLTKFFVDLDLDYVHDGSTRSVWVESALNSINEMPSNNKDLPSQGMIKVIESLVHPDNYLFNEKYNLEKARSDVDKLLELNQLKLHIQNNGEAKVVSSLKTFISTELDSVNTPEKVITFSPSVFKVPNKEQNLKLISVMMPFNTSFRGTYEAIKRVADYLNLDCYRADDIWENTTFIQDIFDLIYCAQIVIVDFTGRNPNVMYETGIAHTLGKTVIPITQSLDDIPSDLGHHRAYKYLANDQGYRDLSNELYKRIKTVMKI
jgi:hypothetical protein